MAELLLNRVYEAGSKSCRGLILLCSLILGIFPASPARAAEPSSAISKLAEIPVQHAGRVKPFESFAREALLFVTGKTRLEGTAAVRVLWEWITRPEVWNSRPFIPVSYKPLQKEFSLMLVEGRLSPEIALNHSPFLSKVEAALQKREAKEGLTLLEKKTLEVYERALFVRRAGEGAMPGWIAHPGDVRAGWLTLGEILQPEGREALLGFYPESGVGRALESFRQVFAESRDSENHMPSLESARALEENLRALMESRGVVLDRGPLTMELLYARLNAFGWAWKLYLAAGLAGFLGLLWPRWKGGFAPLFFAAFLLHGCGFFLRCMIAGRPPVTNMYESVVWVSWAVAIFSLVLSFFFRLSRAPLFAAFVSAFALAVAESFPALLDPTVAPLVPVLRSNWWLTVHVLTITLSYGAFALAWGIGHGALYGLAFRPEKEEGNQQLVTALYRALQIGVVLLAAGTVLGGVWANDSWGRFWGWDPKETWALIALLGYLAVLHGRYAGWLGPFGFCAGAVTAFLGVLMAWYGVNFVLGAGLHSYGFGGGGLPYVLAAVGVDLLFVLVAALRHQRLRTSSGIFS